ncbi:MAG TPA: FAD:protein FMN transferase, partial [Flavisolibacter sp.]|nr:FAD:protein FMN transferase [Flavisolibacter sp.]
MVLCKKIEKLMGNRFELTVISENEKTAEENIDLAIQETKRIEALLTTFNETSQTCQVNSMAGKEPVKVDKEVFDLIERSLKISELTQGAFDITYGSIDKSLWNFDTGMKKLPDKAIAKKMVKRINYKNVLLDRSNLTVFLKQKGMRIGFGGIGKGYAADKAKELLINNGIENGVVNAAGDLITWGKQINGKDWTIGIADPNNKMNPFSFMEISNMAVATSGNYEKYVII